jgi:hypothetical protein
MLRLLRLRRRRRRLLLSPCQRLGRRPGRILRHGKDVMQDRQGLCPVPLVAEHAQQQGDQRAAGGRLAGEDLGTLLRGGG